MYASMGTRPEAVAAFGELSDSGRPAGQKELQRWVLVRRGLKLEPSQAKRLLLALDADSDGKLSEADFVRGYTAARGEQVRHRLLAATYTTGEQDWVSLFDRYDRSGTGELECDEFAALLSQQGGLKFGQAEMRDFFEYVDASGSGAVSPEEFMRLLWKRAPKSHTSTGADGVDALIRRVYDCIDGNSSESASERSTGGTLRSFFYEVDSAGGGSVGLQELKAGLTGSGIQISNAETKALIQALDTDGDGRLSLGELLQGSRRARRDRAASKINDTFCLLCTRRVAEMDQMRVLVDRSELDAMSWRQKYEVEEPKYEEMNRRWSEKLLEVKQFEAERTRLTATVESLTRRVRENEQLLDAAVGAASVADIGYQKQLRAFKRAADQQHNNDISAIASSGQRLKHARKVAQRRTDRIHLRHILHQSFSPWREHSWVQASQRRAVARFYHALQKREECRVIRQCWTRLARNVGRTQPNRLHKCFIDWRDTSAHRRAVQRKTETIQIRGKLQACFNTWLATLRSGHTRRSARLQIGRRILGSSKARACFSTWYEHIVRARLLRRVRLRRLAAASRGAWKVWRLAVKSSTQIITFIYARASARHLRTQFVWWKRAVRRALHQQIVCARFAQRKQASITRRAFHIWRKELLCCQSFYACFHRRCMRNAFDIWANIRTAFDPEVSVKEHESPLVPTAVVNSQLLEAREGHAMAIAALSHGHEMALQELLAEQENHTAKKLEGATAGHELLMERQKHVLQREHAVALAERVAMEQEALAAAHKAALETALQAASAEHASNREALVKQQASARAVSLKAIAAAASAETTSVREALAREHQNNLDVQRQQADMSLHATVLGRHKATGAVGVLQDERAFHRLHAGKEALPLMAGMKANHAIAAGNLAQQMFDAQTDVHTQQVQAAAAPLSFRMLPGSGYELRADAVGVLAAHRISNAAIAAEKLAESKVAAESGAAAALYVEHNSTEAAESVASADSDEASLRHQQESLCVAHAAEMDEQRDMSKLESLGSAALAAMEAAHLYQLEKKEASVTGAKAVSARLEEDLASAMEAAEQSASLKLEELSALRSALGAEHASAVAQAEAAQAAALAAEHALAVEVRVLAAVSALKEEGAAEAETQAVRHAAALAELEEHSEAKHSEAMDAVLERHDSLAAGLRSEQEVAVAALGAEWEAKVEAADVVRKEEQSQRRAGWEAKIAESETVGRKAMAVAAAKHEQAVDAQSAAHEERLVAAEEALRAAHASAVSELQSSGLAALAAMEAAHLSELANESESAAEAEAVFGQPSDRDAGTSAILPDNINGRLEPTGFAAAAMGGTAARDIANPAQRVQEQAVDSANPMQQVQEAVVEDEMLRQEQMVQHLKAMHAAEMDDQTKRTAAAHGRIADLERIYAPFHSQTTPTGTVNLDYFDSMLLDNSSLAVTPRRQPEIEPLDGAETVGSRSHSHSESHSSSPHRLDADESVAALTIDNWAKAQVVRQIQKLMEVFHSWHQHAHAQALLMTGHRLLNIALRAKLLRHCFVPWRVYGRATAEHRARSDYVSTFAHATTQRILLKSTFEKLVQQFRVSCKIVSRIEGIVAARGRDVVRAYFHYWNDFRFLQVRLVRRRSKRNLAVVANIWHEWAALGQAQDVHRQLRRQQMVQTALQEQLAVAKKAAEEATKHAQTQRFQTIIAGIRRVLTHKQHNFLAAVLHSWRSHLQWCRNLQLRAAHYHTRAEYRQVRDVFEAWGRRWYDAGYVKDLHVQLRLHWQALDCRDAEIEHLRSLVVN